jgi:4-amino-4-deoxy-L-arabinose transferase-like glycosyltransferase
MDGQSSLLSGRRCFLRSLLLCLLAGALFLGRLDLPLLEPEEARYAEIPREMLAESRLIVPVLHGQVYGDKPPLLYWLVMGCYALLGRHDWAARLVPGAAGILTVLLSYRWGRHILGERTALAGALVLCLSPRFVYLARNLSMDGLLCLAVTGALLAGRAALARPQLRWRWWLLSAGCVGVGLLAKGPVALALVVPPLFACRLLCRGSCRPAALAWFAYLLTALAVAGPWYVALAVADPTAAADFLWRHHVLRYVEPFDHARPVWFYLPDLLGALLPAAALVPAVWLVKASGWHQPAGKLPCPSADAGCSPFAELSFYLLAGLWCFLFFSASGCKRAIYLLPALPMLALVVGWHLAVLSRWPRFAWGGGLLAGGVMLGWLHFWLPAHHRAFSLREQVQQAAGGAADLPVWCCPRFWDSVSFYLDRDDVRLCPAGRLGDLWAELRSDSAALLFVKVGRALDELRCALPPGWELIPSRPHAGVVAARVRLRAQGGS